MTQDITLTTDGTRLDLYIPGKPIAQPRAKVTTRNGFATAYVESKHPVHGYRTDVKAAWQDAGSITLAGPLLLVAEFVFPRPTSKVWKTKPMPRYAHTGKPDLDNCVKAVLDALESCAFSNDSAVCRFDVFKWVAAGDELPHTKLSLIELGE